MSNSPNAIGYGTGGIAFGNVTAHVENFPGVSETRVGWTGDGGIAAQVGTFGSYPAVGKVEFLHMDLGNVQCPGPNCGGTTTVRSSFNTLRFGANLAF